MKSRLRAGDIYITQVPDGRYAAMRVLRVVDKTSLIETSEYLDRERPSLDDPRLLRPVAENRFRFRGEPARLWLEGRPPDNYELLGTIPPSEAEATTECNTFGGKWHRATGHEAYIEWRWIHDRDTLEREQRERAASTERRTASHKPKKMIDEDTFWSIIGLFDWTHEGDDERVIAPAIAALAQKAPLDIRRWQERLAFLLFQLDTKAHAASFMGSSDLSELSPDGFLYARCVVIANGRESYESVLRRRSAMPQGLEFEALLSIAPGAYELKTGEDLDYTTGCSYETFSNSDGWRI